MKFATVVQIMAFIHHLVWSVLGLLVLFFVYYFFTSGYKAFINPDQQFFASPTPVATLTPKPVK